MKIQPRLVRGLFVIASILAMFSSPAIAAQIKGSHDTAATTLSFDGTIYQHRWSKDGQNEFTPRGDNNLARWHDMVTVNLHEAVTSGEQLAELANKVLGNYQRQGKILRTNSRPRIANRPAEHLIVAMLGAPTFLEATFARFLLSDGVGVIAVYSHRVYGKPAGPAMSLWLKTNGPQMEKALLAWKTLPTPAALRQLPQSK